ncbi:MAG: hypothetical protein MJ245_03465 [Clostridia bacterium]|nr:hypothetical protein [Clostridia bacterium]
MGLQEVIKERQDRRIFEERKQEQRNRQAIKVNRNYMNTIADIYSEDLKENIELIAMEESEHLIDLASNPMLRAKEKIQGIYSFQNHEYKLSKESDVKCEVIPCYDVAEDDRLSVNPNCTLLKFTSQDLNEAIESQIPDDNNHAYEAYMLINKDKVSRRNPTGLDGITIIDTENYTRETASDYSISSGNEINMYIQNSKDVETALDPNSFTGYEIKHAPRFVEDSKLASVGENLIPLAYEMAELENDKDSMQIYEAAAEVYDENYRDVTQLSGYEEDEEFDRD